MSERIKASKNENDSKNTRLPIREEFHYMRFSRDALGHLSRYLLVTEKIVKLANKLKRPLKVIDIGCGDVYVLRVLSKCHQIPNETIMSSYLGVDLDDISLKRTDEEITAPSVRNIMSLEVGDITTGYLKKFKDEQFDVLVNLEVLEHIQPHFVPIVLKEYARISKYQFISTPNFTGGTGKIPQDHIKEWDTDELKEEMKKAGLNVLKRIGIFSNLNKVRKIAEKDEMVAYLYNLFEDKFDKNMFSLVMARIVGTDAQNVLYICKTAKK